MCHLCIRLPVGVARVVRMHARTGGGRRPRLRVASLARKGRARVARAQPQAAGHPGVGVAGHGTLRSVPHVGAKGKVCLGGLPYSTGETRHRDGRQVWPSGGFSPLVIALLATPVRWQKHDLGSGVLPWVVAMMGGGARTMHSASMHPTRRALGVVLERACQGRGIPFVFVVRDIV